MVLCEEALANVEGVRVKFDGHHVASTGDHHLLSFPSTQSATQTGVSVPASAPSDTKKKIPFYMHMSCVVYSKAKGTVIERESTFGR